MAVSRDGTYILKAWHHSVSIADHTIQVTLNDSHFSCQLSGAENRTAGWYAKYHEGIFVFLKDNNNHVIIGWNQNIVDVEKINNTTWTNTFYGRLFECFDQSSQSVLKCNYHTFRRFAFNPLKILGDLLIPDDDWGLECDLPSVIHSCIEEEVFE